ncbi:hypothetical protein V2632_15970, partial [Tenacibaculum maritimum]|uniref:hypothetical protein n=1 Tax=Tenacibaculum maritimum TaxID=107401 RepID=UPI00387776D4
DLNLNPQNFIWFFSNRNSKEVQDIKDFLAVNNNAIEAEEFAIKAIESKSSKYLNENFELTKNSPFNVDMAQVLDSIDLPANDPNKIANQKFLCIYNKIIKSPKFKSLFTNVFGEHKAINAKFVIANDFPTNPVTNLQSNGNCRLENYTLTSDGSIKAANVLIKINQNKLTTGNTREISSILMAKTIIHESIHAFLSVKVKDCNIGITIDQLNNLEFEELIKEYYDGTCATGQEQHQFMFDYLEPILSEILTDIRDDVIPASQIRRMDSETLYVNGISTPFNWDDFFFNLSLEGLHNTEAFENEIKSDIVKNEKFEKYIGIFAVRFSKNCNN